MNLMHHRDYVARIGYDEEREVFHGRIVNLRDVVNFYGHNPEELKREFQRSLETYLELCHERGIEPGKPYSGRFNIRMSPEQHRRIAEAAEHEGQSLNAWALETLEEAARREARSSG